MDHVSETERMKLYYQGLDAAGERAQIEEDYPVFVNWLADPDCDGKGREEVVFLLDVFYPLYKKLAYVNNNRLIHEDILEYDPAPQRAWAAAEIYAILHSLAPYAVGEVLRTIGCTSGTMTQLQQCYDAQDKEAFCRTIDTADCDLNLVSNICEDIWPRNQYLTDSPEEDIVAGLDVVASLLHDVEHRVSQSSQQLSTSVETYFEDGDEESYLQKVTNYNRDAFDWLCSIYRDNYARFKPKERQQIEPIILKGGGSVDPEFHLPDDYFSVHHESSRTEEFFGLHPDVVNAGPEAFRQLVDYLAEAGYIDSSAATKRLWCYRFSGRMRPMKLEPIEWHGKNGRSYELIYLVRNLTERADYRKMRSFFTGPKWVASCDSSYARGADFHLKEFLHKLYPTLPDQL